MDYNKIIFSGRLTADAELKYVTSGSALLSFSVANSPNYKDKDITYFFRCSLWGKRAETMKDYLTKGTAVIIDGQLQINKYTKQNGDTAYFTQVFVQDLQFAPTNNSSRQQSPSKIENWDDVPDPAADRNQKPSFPDIDEYNIPF